MILPWDGLLLLFLFSFSLSVLMHRLKLVHKREILRQRREEEDINATSGKQKVVFADPVNLQAHLKSVATLTRETMTASYSDMQVFKDQAQLFHFNTPEERRLTDKFTFPLPPPPLSDPRDLPPQPNLPTKRSLHPT